MDISEEDFLKHYGVKGMKWGVRKDRSDKSTSQKIKRGAAFTAASLLATGAITTAVVRNRNISKTAAQQKVIRDTLSYAFQAKDSAGNVVFKFGTQVTPETLKALRR